MLSIIIPVYNAAPYIERCVESVLTQGVSDMELIAVNDGSTDNSLALLHRLAESDARVRVVDKPNGGVSSARNMGMDLAKGDMLMFVDADDYIIPDTLTKAYDLIVKHPDTDLFVFGMRRCSRSKDKGFHECVPSEQKYNGEEISKYIMSVDALMFGSPCTKIYKKIIIDQEKIRFDINQKLYEDFCFNSLYIRKCEKVLTSSIVLYCYDINYQSATGKFNGQTFLNNLHFFENAQNDMTSFFANKYENIEDASYKITKQYKKTYVFLCLFEIYNLYRTAVKDKIEWLTILMNEMKRIEPNHGKYFTTAVPKAVYKAYSIHPLLAHILLTCIFKTESIYRKIKK